MVEHCDPVNMLSVDKRSYTFPEIGSPLLGRSYSQEDLLSSSQELVVESEDTQFADVTMSRILHSASESDLMLAGGFSGDDQQKAIEDLKLFAKTAPKLKPKEALNVASSTIFGCESHPDPSKVAPPNNPTKEATVKQTSNPLLSHLNDLRGPGVEHLARSSQTTKPVSKELSQNNDQERGAPALLGNWIGNGLESRRKQFESATVTMKRILDNKSSEAPTSVISEDKRASLSQGRPVLRWNDKTYNYLPHYVALGKAGAVRELLSAKCNPGTQTKPRLSPIFNAVRGATNRHTKCLQALVEYKVDVNVIKPSNGRRPLHYAIEGKTWSGYSTVVYILFVARADPNAKDRAGDIALLMLLVGNGQLPQEKRDALYLLPAPNFHTDLDVSIPGTLDNPLHLAIRRKDGHVVDAILQKMKQTHGLASKLMHKQNGSGFTPILLAFSIFTMADDAAEEVYIVKLLLENGANPNDKDATQGDTSLHRVVRDLKNSRVLELLCNYCADPNTMNKARKTPLNLIKKARMDSPLDEWYLFAGKIIGNGLKDTNYRPPDLEEYLSKEDERQKAAGSSTKTKKPAFKRKNVRFVGDQS